MDFAQERAAYLGGYGRPAALREALRAQVLFVPLDADDRFFTLTVDDAAWMVAFSTWERAQDFARAAGRDLAAVNVSEMTGSTLIDRVVTQGPVPTGLAVDPHQADVMVFPPETLDVQEM